MHLFPLVERIPCPDILMVFAALPRFGTIFLDSANCQHPNANYSFIACDPFHVMGLNDIKGQNPFMQLERSLAHYSLPLLPDCPPFQGGVAGSFGYELGIHLEKIPGALKNDLQFPEMLIGFYDLVLAIDHTLNQAWVFSSGFPEIDPKKRLIRAQKRLDWFLEIIATCLPLDVPHFQPITPDEIHANFTQSEYEQAVEKVREYILAGDIFEANISQRFSALFPENLMHFDLYRTLRQNNPAPFSGYLEFGDYVIASASPERSLQLRAGEVEACPIKGTAPRSADPTEDKKAAEKLLASEKDKAENTMIVDLMRNDLSRVCLPHSVKVPTLCGLESFATVHHLVSRVQGKLMPNKKAIDLLKATFPGGSIIGAPKIRAMEIIAEIEPTVRGPYCGSMGYIGFNGEMDLSIIIRSFVCRKNWVTYQVGGAVTFDSDPHEEYLETLHKGKAMRKTLGILS
jgi:para-aminobenzoate synthetase component I